MRRFWQGRPTVDAAGLSQDRAEREARAPAVGLAYKGGAMLKRIPLFCQESGYSEKAVARKIEDGVWVEGREYVRAPDGRLLIDMDGFNKWALGEQRWAEKQQAAR